jgi:Ca2+-binding RTX toxin-like protein
LYGDLLEGGPGDDRLVPGVDKRVKDHDGFERINFAHSDMPVVMDLSARGRWGAATGDGEDRIRLGSRLKVIGSALDDTMTGSGGDDHLLGGPGADRLSGLGGRDTLEGGSFTPALGDDDVLDGGEGPDAIVTFGGRDVIHGGPGGDFVGTYGTLPVKVYGDEGNDDLLGAAVAESGYLVDGGPGRDNAQLGSPVKEAISQAGTAGFDQATGVWQVSFLAGRVSPTAASSTGRAVGIEEVDLGWEFAWTYSGTNGPDVVTGSYYFPLHATMLRGDDIVSGSRWRRSVPAADAIDGGDGHDVGYLITAEDTAIGLEETYPDELVIP